MSDDSMIKLLSIMQMDYSPATESTKAFGGAIETLDKQIADLKASAMQNVKDINNIFTSQLGNLDTKTLNQINKFYSHMQKQNKPIEIEVVTDKAEKEMLEFARSMGIKLDKNLKEQFKGLANSLLGDFDQSKFDDLAKSVTDAYLKAEKKHNKRIQEDMFKNTDEMRIYEYLKDATLKLDESTVSAKRNVDGFSQAIRNLVKQSSDAGLSLDQMAQELESMGVKNLGPNTEDIAEKMTKAVQSIREFKQVFVELGSDVPVAEIEQFVKNTLGDLILNLNRIQTETKQTTESFNDMVNVETPVETIKNIMGSLKEEVGNLGVVTRQTFKGMNDEVYKYIDTYKNLEQQISVSDTYVKNKDGDFNFSGRIINDKSVEVDYKSIQKAWEEALKLDEVFNRIVVKNKDIGKGESFNQYLNSISKVSKEVERFQKWQENADKSTLKAFSEIEVAQMKASAASIEQKLYSRGLTDEYYRQAGTLREQLAIIQNRLKMEGKLTDEESLQTSELEKQLKLLQAQSSEEISDSKKKHSTGFGEEMDRRFGWFLSGKMFYSTINAAKQATKTIKDVEMGMVEIGRVMTDSSFVFEDYRDNLLKLGVEYGQTFDTVQQIALRWAQSGYNVADSLELTRTSLLALNTAELDAKNATESMIGIMAQWQLQAEDMALVMDKVNITADRHSVTSQDLVDGLLRSSGAARIMNLSLDETIGLLTVMREASGRTGQEVGNALNSILSYIQRPTSIKTLEGLGIGMFADEAKTQFRNVLDIFKDIAVNWNTLSADIQDGFVKSADEAGLFSEEIAAAIGSMEEWTDLQQRDISQAAAGVYRRNYFIGMIERLSNVQGVLNNMIDAEGYSMRENERTMDTLEKKMQSLKTAIEQLAVALGDSGLLDVLKGIVDAGTGAITMFNSLDDGIQKPILAFSSMFTVMKTGQHVMKMFGLGGIDTKKALSDVAEGTTIATTGIKAFVSGVGGWVTIAAIAIPLLIKFADWLIVTRAERMQAIQDSKDSAETYKGEIEQLTRLSEEYENIIDNANRTEAEKARLVQIQRELAGTFPELITGFDEEGNAVTQNSKAIRDLIDVKKLLMKHELEAMQLLASSELPKLKKEIDETDKRIQEITQKLRTGDTKENVWVSQKDGIMEIKDMTSEYTKELDKLIKQQGLNRSQYEELLKVIGLYDEYMVLQNGTLDDARKKLGILTETELEELKVVKELSAEDTKKTIARLNNDKEVTETMIANTRVRISAMQSEMAAMMALTGGKAKNVSAMTRMYEDSEIASASMMDQITMKAQNKAIQAQRELVKLEGNAKSIDKALANVGALTGAGGGGGAGGSSSAGKGSGGGSSSYSNKELEHALKMLEHGKKLSEETQDTIKAEIAELYRINSMYVNTQEERMDMAERIYAAEKRLRDRTLQDSVNWINEKKAFNQLTVEEEIAAWERVKNNQIDNINAVKQATLELYKLRSQIMTESFAREENTIKHLTRLGILSVDEQIAKYQELYHVKATSLAEEQARVENLFGLYKKLISDQQGIIKDAYDERIEQIDKEAKRRKEAQEDIIKGIEKEIELLNKQEDEYDHEKKMAELNEQLEYWKVRTSEDARKKVAELTKQIAEAEHKREVDLKKQSLEDKKKIAQDEIKNIEDTAREERERLDKSYKRIEVSFDEHSINMIALASTMSKGMFEEFKKNYLDPLETALRSADYNAVDRIVSGINEFGDSLTSDYGDRYRDESSYSKHDWNMTDADYLRFRANGDRWAELDRQGFKMATNAEMQRLNAENNMLRLKYHRNPDLGEYPQFHTGGWAYSDGMAVLKKNELVFPPDLSIGIAKLFPLLSNLAKSNVGAGSSSMTDNRKQIQIDRLLNIERNYMEDDVDSDILARQLQRQLSYMF